MRCNLPHPHATCCAIDVHRDQYSLELVAAHAGKLQRFVRAGRLTVLEARSERRAWRHCLLKQRARWWRHQRMSPAARLLDDFIYYFAAPLWRSMASALGASHARRMALWHLFQWRPVCAALRPLLASWRLTWRCYFVFVYIGLLTDKILSCLDCRHARLWQSPPRYVHTPPKCMLRLPAIIMCRAMCGHHDVWVHRHPEYRRNPNKWFCRSPRHASPPDVGNLSTFSTPSRPIRSTAARASTACAPHARVDALASLQCQALPFGIASVACRLKIRWTCVMCEALTASSASCRGLSVSTDPARTAAILLPATDAIQTPVTRSCCGSLFSIRHSRILYHMCLICCTSRSRRLAQRSYPAVLLRLTSCRLKDRLAHVSERNLGCCPELG